MLRTPFTSIPLRIATSSAIGYWCFSYSDRSFVGRSFSWKQNTVLVRVITKIESHWLTIAFTNSVFPFRNSEDANSMNRFARL